MLPASDLGTPRKRGSASGSSTGGSERSGARRSGANAAAAPAPPHPGKPRRAREALAAGLTKRRLLIIAAVGTAAVVAIAAGAGAAAGRRRGGGGGGRGGGALDSGYCDALPGDARGYCHAYADDAGQSRFAAASQWEKMSSITYDCAGLVAQCLNADLKTGKGPSSCKTLADGAACTRGKTCMLGLCGGPAAYEEEQAAAAETRAEQQSGDAAGATGAGKGAPRAPPKPVNSWANFTAAIDSSARGPRVPATFLATSHEWDRIMDYAENVEAFKNVFREFGPSPILRMGGASQDFLTAPPPREIWEAMAKMHVAFNARYLIGLPLWKPDSIELSRKMMAMAREILPKGALLGFELGNEPEFWPTSVGGYEAGKPDAFVPGFESYASYFARTAAALNPCGPGEAPQLAGPGWGNVNTIDAAWLAQMAKAPGVRCYMRELSVHYYPYVNNDTIDAAGLLDQGLQDFGLSKFNWLNGVAKASQMPMRISETNSLYGGGRAGLSDTMAGTLWCADALFAFAHAGAAGFHFHWGFGGRPIHGGQPNTGVQTNFFADNPTRPYPSVHAPWYGYLLFRAATSSNNGFSDATLLNVAADKGACAANVKVWALAADGGALRVALLNKDAGADCNVVVTVDDHFCGGRGALSRLAPGGKGMMSKDGLTWRGQSYDGVANGKIQGAARVEAAPVSRKPPGGGRCEAVVPMPRASGALLELQPTSPAPAARA